MLYLVKLPLSNPPLYNLSCKYILTVKYSQFPNKSLLVYSIKWLHVHGWIDVPYQLLLNRGILNVYYHKSFLLLFYHRYDSLHRFWSSNDVEHCKADYVSSIYICRYAYWHLRVYYTPCNKVARAIMFLTCLSVSPSVLFICKSKFS